MKLTQKELIRRLRLCRKGSVKELMYGCIFAGTIGFCLKCGKLHAGVCK